MTKVILGMIFLIGLLICQPVEIGIPDCAADSGATLLVPITISTVTGRDIIGVDITLNFRAEVLVAESVWAGNVIPTNWMILYNATNPGELIIAMAGANSLSGAGTLCTLKFMVTGRPNDTTTIHFSRCELNEGNVLCTSSDGIFTVNAVGIDDNEIEKVLLNFSASPNPFNLGTEISYKLAVTIRIRIYSSSGQEIATLLNGVQNPGSYSVEWNGKDNKGKDCPAGIYFYRLENEKYQVTKKIVKMP